ncbi:MAG: glycosyltransferase family 4 protein [Chloroflexota bacterium]
MHIGFITADLSHTHGWAHYSLAMTEAVRAQGVEVTVVAASNSPTDYDFPLYPILPTVKPAERNQLRKLIGVASQARAALANCDLIHCTTEPYAPLAAWVAGPRPYLQTGHGTYARAGWNRHPLVRRLHQRAFRMADLVVCDSHYTERVAREYTPGITSTTVTLAIDPSRFTDLPPLPEPVTRPTILTAGGVKKRKGTPQLVEAVAAVRQQLPNVQCIVIGSTDQEPETVARVRTLIDTHELHDHVQLLGFVDEPTLRGWYGAADVFALPSINDGYKFEGFGLVHLEASAAGLPVVGADNCGAEDAVVHNETGLLVSQANLTEELPGALLTLLTDPALRRRMGEAGRAHARRQTWDAKAAEMIALYEVALSP